MIKCAVEFMVCVCSSSLLPSSVLLPITSKLTGKISRGETWLHPSYVPCFSSKTFFAKKQPLSRAVFEERSL